MKDSAAIDTIMSASQPTQQCTQEALDPRRLGRNNSGLSERDVADVICVLHPASPAAFRIVSHTAKTNPQHVLQNQGLPMLENDSSLASASQAETIVVKSMGAEVAQDLALRFSSRVCDPTVGFCFGRNTMQCDITLDPVTNQRRVSNKHFRIYINDSGALMLEDTSTNGTMVDSVNLGGKRNNGSCPDSRILLSGSIIEILATTQEDIVKFIVKIPARDYHQDEYRENFQRYMSHVACAKERARAMAQGLPIPEAAARGMFAAPLAGPPNSKAIPTAVAPIATSTNHPMHWDGGGKYSCVAVLGKGAFAIVYQVATTFKGEYYAAKEFEKKRFMKGGVLDSRIENEMQIMKELRHANIARYVDYVEAKNHMYIIMEYIPGGDLQGYMQSHGTVPEESARLMSQQVLSALDYLHAKNITHRDIKPDNILLCTENPFIVKLTDFGLSKVVKNNETFLKTFCGTLLYCAPEVFPHYDNYVANRRPKRRRHSGCDAKSTNRSYSQLVDIWSYAAVLWTALCGRSPYEGVVDGNGKGMFEKIMETPLDPGPLKEQGVSEDAIDMLLRMLDTNPATRPSERDCLRDPWLDDGRVPEPNEEGGSQLGMVEEEDEDELDASQLSIHDNPEPAGKNLHYGSAGLTNLRSSKRLKGQPSQQSEFDDTTQFLDVPIIKDFDHQSGQPHHVASKPPKLFGEISQPALRSSGALHESQLPEEVYEDDDDNVVIHTGDSPRSRTAHVAQSDLGSSQDHNLGDRSLLGAESMVRGLHMGNSGGTTPHTPGQSRNPSYGNKGEQHHHSSSKGKSRRGSRQSSDVDITPKAKPLERGINLNLDLNWDIRASFFHGSTNNESTRNPEHASRVKFPETSTSCTAGAGNSLPETVNASYPSSRSGHLSQPTHNLGNKENEQHLSMDADAGAAPGQGDKAIGQSLPPSPSMPTQEVQAAPGQADPTSASTRSNPNSIPPNTAPTSQSSPSAASNTDATGLFRKPAPRLGRLISTPDSFKSLTIPLEKIVTTFGRNFNSSVVYPDKEDTRVPKRALEVWFHARGIAEADRDGRDWTRLEGLHVVLRTHGRNGVLVNGVPLLEEDERGRLLYGRLREGDEIVVCEGRERLAFVCEGFVGGSGGARRAPGEERFVVQIAEEKRNASGGAAAA